MITSDQLYRHALKDHGLQERPGPQSQPRIAQAIKVAADWLPRDDSETAWCGCIRGMWGIETGTGVPAAHYRAKNWLNWGLPISISQAKRGDTVVLRRPGGHHVALWDHLSDDKSKIYLLGGNQSNSVNVQAYDVALIVGIRRVNLAAPQNPEPLN